MAPVAQVGDLLCDCLPAQLPAIADSHPSRSSCDYDYVEVTGGIRHPPGLLDSSGGRICGNWNERIKLLRFMAPRNIQITFVSDFSHAFKGFKAEVLIVNDDDEDLNGHPERRCESGDYKFHGGHCYLVGGMPQ
ncbi:hypothetical protein BIW11_07809, partial [Tropilaelaps mercedesae]